MSADPPAGADVEEDAAGAEESRRKLRHDLRTPIHQILGYAELLEEEAHDRGHEACAPDLQRIQKAARQLLALVDRAFGHPGSAAGTGVNAPVSEPSPVEAEAAGGAAAVAAPETVHGRILVVDDNPANLDVLSRRLSARGLEVRCADSGLAALELVAREPFDLVLLDVMMPGVSGLEVLRRLRERHAPADLPVIMATARDHSGDVVSALAAGANDYVTKPLDLPVVMARVQTQLGLKRAQDEIHRLVEQLERKTSFIAQVFGRYVSEDIAESLLESPERLRLGGETRKVTVLLSDLRGFTPIAESLRPEQVVMLLNNYLGRMADLISAHRGTVDEFLGDGILAVFGALASGENDALRAMACAVEMQLRMEEVNAFNRAHGLPELEMGIAVNTGEAVVGNIGSDKRAKYGVIGTPVNLAARIESGTVGGEILVSQSTLDDAGPCVEVGEARTVLAKGVSGPITVHVVRGVGAPYDLRLPERTDELAPLARPLAVEVSLLAGKQLGEARFAGHLVSLGEHGALLRTGEPLEALGNVLLRLEDEPGGEGARVPAGDLYAKVTRAADGEATLRYTSVPPAIAEFLRARRAAG